MRDFCEFIGMCLGMFLGAAILLFIIVFAVYQLTKAPNGKIYECKTLSDETVYCEIVYAERGCYKGTTTDGRYVVIKEYKEVSIDEMP